MLYEIKGDFPNQQYLQIRAKIQVHSDEIEIQFPKWRPGRYELGNFAKNVRGFAAYDKDGKSLNAEKIDTHVWKIHNISNNELYVEYAYYAAELNAGSSFLSHEMLYVNPVNCLAYIKGRESEKCELQVHLNQPMKYAGTLPEKNGFIQAESYHDLVDSPFVYSLELSTQSYHYQGVEFKISFVGLNEIPWTRVLHDFQKFTQSQWDDFGDFPSKTFHFINIITPYPHYHGVEHKASTMIVLGPNYKIFNVYYDELLGISSHELYHVWNVKSIRSVDLWPYDYSRENLSEMGYLCEGITTYLGDYYLMKSGVWSKQKYLGEWEQVIQKHIENFGRFNASLAESSFDTWLDGYTAGAPGRKTSIYNEGAIFAFITDVFIRKNTKGAKSISHLMKALYNQFFKLNLGVAHADFIHLVEEISGNSNYRELFNTLIFSRVSFESYLSDSLSILGLQLDFVENSDFVASKLGIKVIHEHGLAKVLNILPGCVADLAGMMLNDKIIAINNFVIQNDFDHWLGHFKNEELHLLINRHGKIIQIDIPKVQYTYFKKALIKSIPQADDLALLNW